jgi:hypothetical protein
MKNCMFAILNTGCCHNIYFPQQSSSVLKVLAFFLDGTYLLFKILLVYYHIIITLYFQNFITISSIYMRQFYSNIKMYCTKLKGTVYPVIMITKDFSQTIDHFFQT